MDVKRLVSVALEQPGVVVARDVEHMCSEDGQKFILNDVAEHSLNRVVVASCSPLFHEKTFMKTMEKANLNPYLFDMANIREHCSWCHTSKQQATKKAEDLVRMAIAKCALHEPLQRKRMPIGKRVLVIGGGIAGIQASLDLGDSGFEVYLVEKEASIGGKMAMLSKTFPTEDCATCIIGPKLADVAEHPNIHLYTYSEVESVSGYLGNFHVRVRRKPRYVDLNKCTACGDCTKECPVEMPNEFNLGLSKRKAIHIYNDIAVPHKYLITKIGTPPCRASCPIHVNVQGYIQLIKKGKFEEALALVRETNPFPGITGRICTHPCENACTRENVDEPLAIDLLKRFVYDYAEKQEKKWELSPPPFNGKKVAIVGSGPAGLMAAFNLRMLGYEVTVFERMPEIGGMLRYGIPTYRLPREVLDKELNVLHEIGVQFITDFEVRGKEGISQLLQDFHAVFLAVGTWHSRKMGIPGEDLPGVTGALEFLREANLGKITQVQGKAAVIGGGNAAIDAARTLLRLGAQEVEIIYRRTRNEMPANPEEIEEAIMEGIKLRFLEAPTQIEKDEVGLLLTLQKMELKEPDSSGRRRPVPVPGSEVKEVFQFVVMAVGQELESENRFDLKMEDGRITADPLTLETSMPGVFAGGDAVLGPATFIEALAHGKKAAISIDRFLNFEDMRIGREFEGPFPSQVQVETAGVEKSPRARPKLDLPKSLVSHFAEVNSGLPQEAVKGEAERCLNCGGCSECGECVRACEPKAINFGELERVEELEADTIIVATGFDLFDPSLKPVYQYGSSSSILTALELERIIATGSSGPPLRAIGNKVAFIQCVGSRDEQIGRENCSRICCMYATKLAQLLKRLDPSREIYIFYTDLRAYGKGFEEYYKRAQKSGIRYIRGRVAEIQRDPQSGALILTAEDTLTRGIISAEFDTVVLSAGLVPSPDSDKISEMLKLAKSPDGFLQEAHPKFRPVDTLVDGVFIAGCAQGPKDIPDTVAQASAAASRAIRLMNKGYYEIEPISAFLHQELCDGCGICLSSCPVGAIVRERGTIKINEALCKGCGICLAHCPKEALDLHYYTNAEMKAQIEEALKGKKPDEIRVLVFADSVCTYRLADNLGTSRISYPVETRIIRVPSGARVTPSLLLQAFSSGADGIFIGECDRRASPYPGSNQAIEENVRIVQEILKEEGAEAERLKYAELLTSLLTDFFKNVAALVKYVKREVPQISPEVRERIKERAQNLWERVQGARG
ncbi:MAG: FAD-dependent oxidoreductase [Coprothermobacterota bacterium]|nr:FAD-dependent oxidoreductase [Coprothermobacterota bacterium]